MIARAPLYALRLFVLLLLTTIGLQALTPLPAPLDRSHGSAFSASTLDVALASGERMATSKAKLVWKDRFYWPPCIVCRPAPLEAYLTPQRPSQSSGRLRRPPILDLIPAPRAPPYS